MDREPAGLFDLHEVLAATNGDWLSAGSGARGSEANGQPGAGGIPWVSSVTVDSRSAKKGSLFVALAGERTDGHLFVDDAIRNGSSLCLVNRTFAQEHKEKIHEILVRHGERIITVNDTLAALQNLSRFHMRRLHGVVTVGVTGSTGKTTTKEILGSVLLRESSGFMNQGNLNSEIGLPLSTFDVKPGHRYAIFEMGISHQGEMDVLADIVRPELAVITNIGLAHVGFLGSQDGIAAEKKRIFSHFDGGQTGFVWEDEPYFAFLSAEVSGRVVPYGPRTTPGYQGSEDRGLDGWVLQLGDLRVALPLVGAHNLANALCAVTVASLLGISRTHVKAGLEAVRPLAGRSRILRGPVTIIEDSYNANPEAFERAISFLRDLPWEGRKVLVAGAMKELGAASEEAHTRLAELIRGARFDAVYLFGTEMEAAYRVLAGAGRKITWTEDFDELRRSLADFVVSGDIVLVKGSRAMALERLVEELRVVSAGGAPGRPEGLTTRQGEAGC